MLTNLLYLESVILFPHFQFLCYSYTKPLFALASYFTHGHESDTNRLITLFTGRQMGLFSKILNYCLKVFDVTATLHHLGSLWENADCTTAACQVSTVQTDMKDLQSRCRDMTALCVKRARWLLGTTLSPDFKTIWTCPQRKSGGTFDWRLKL